MRIWAEQVGSGRVVDLDTGQDVKSVVWVDVEKGELCAYALDAQGRKKQRPDGQYLVYVAKGRFKLLLHSASSPLVGADRCAKCGRRATLPSDDLCPPCRAKDRGQRNSMLVERVLPLLTRKCASCSRVATWLVADEVTVSPQVDGGRLFARGFMIARRPYCDRCYEPPRLLDSKGEVVKVYEESARPA